MKTEQRVGIRNLKPGESAVVLGYKEGGRGYRRKLLSMGLTSGTRVRLVKIAPLGDPVLLETRGFSLSLRKAEAEVLDLRREA